MNIKQEPRQGWLSKQWDPAATFATSAGVSSSRKPVHSNVCAFCKGLEEKEGGKKKEKGRRKEECTYTFGPHSWDSSQPPRTYPASCLLISSSSYVADVMSIELSKSHGNFPQSSNQALFAWNCCPKKKKNLSVLGSISLFNPLDPRQRDSTRMRALLS
jgi:hypothetical protein